MKKIRLILSCCFCLLSAITIQSCARNLDDQTENANQSTEQRIWRIMTVGDSLTEGAGKKGFQSYRGHLYNILKQAGYKIDLVGSKSRATAVGGDPDHAGYSGFTIGPDDSDVCGGKCGNSNIVAHLDEIMATPADIITVLIGTNDMWPAENRPVKPEDAPEKLKNLIDAIAQQQPEAKIVVCSLLRLPDGGYASKTKEYEAVNAMARQLGDRDLYDRIYFADLASVSLSQANGDFADVIHLNDRGAQKVAEALAKNLMQVMGQNNRSQASLGFKPYPLLGH